MLLIGFSVNIFCPYFGVNEFLTVVQSVISGQGKTDGHANGKEGHCLKPKELKGHEYSGHGTVGYADKKANHTHCRAEAGGHSQKGCHGIAKGSPHAQGRHNLASLKACPQGHCRKEDFQQKCIIGNHLPLKAPLNQM